PPRSTLFPYTTLFRSGTELEFTASPNDHVDVAVSAGLNNSKLLTTFRDTAGNVVAGIAEGNRLPSVPKFQGSASLTYGWTVSTRSEEHTSELQSLRHL